MSNQFNGSTSQNSRQRLSGTPKYFAENNQSNRNKLKQEDIYDTRRRIDSPNDQSKRASNESSRSTPFQQKNKSMSKLKTRSTSASRLQHYGNSGVSREKDKSLDDRWWYDQIRIKGERCPKTTQKDRGRSRKYNSAHDTSSEQNDRINAFQVSQTDIYCLINKISY